MALQPPYEAGSKWLKITDLQLGVSVFWPWPRRADTKRHVTLTLAFYLFKTTPNAADDLRLAGQLPDGAKVGEAVGDNLQSMLDQGNQSSDSIQMDGGYTMKFWPLSVFDRRRGVMLVDRGDNYDTLGPDAKPLDKAVLIDFAEFALKHVAPYLPATPVAPAKGNPPTFDPAFGFTAAVTRSAYRQVIPRSVIIAALGQTATDLKIKNGPSWLQIGNESGGTGWVVYGSVPDAVAATPITLTGYQSDGQSVDKAFTIPSDGRLVYTYVQYSPPNNNTLTLRIGDDNGAILPKVTVTGPSGWANGGEQDAPIFKTNPILNKPYFYANDRAGATAGTYQIKVLHLGQIWYGTLTLAGTGFERELTLSTTPPTNAPTSAIKGAASISEGNTQQYVYTENGSVVTDDIGLTAEGIKNRESLANGYLIVPQNNETGDGHTLTVVAIRISTQQRLATLEVQVVDATVADVADKVVVAKYHRQNGNFSPPQQFDVIARSNKGEAMQMAYVFDSTATNAPGETSWLDMVTTADYQECNQFLRRPYTLSNASVRVFLRPKSVPSAISYIDIPLPGNEAANLYIAATLGTNNATGSGRVGAVDAQPQGRVVVYPSNRSDVFAPVPHPYQRPDGSWWVNFTDASGSTVSIAIWGIYGEFYTRAQFLALSLPMGYPYTIMFAEMSEPFSTSKLVGQDGRAHGSITIRTY